MRSKKEIEMHIKGIKDNILSDILNGCFTTAVYKSKEIG